MGLARAGVDTCKDEQLPCLSSIPFSEGVLSCCSNAVGRLLRVVCRNPTSRLYPREIRFSLAVLSPSPHLHVPISPPGRSLLQRGDPRRQKASPPKRHIFPAIGMCCTLGCAAHRDALLFGCAAVGMRCTSGCAAVGMRCCWDALLPGCAAHQDALHLLTEAEISSKERKAWLLGKASLSQ